MASGVDWFTQVRSSAVLPYLVVRHGPAPGHLHRLHALRVHLAAGQIARAGLVAVVLGPVAVARGGHRQRGGAEHDGQPQCLPGCAGKSARGIQHRHVSSLQSSSLCSSVERDGGLPLRARTTQDRCRWKPGKCARHHPGQSPAGYGCTGFCCMNRDGCLACACDVSALDGVRSAREESGGVGWARRRRGGSNRRRRPDPAGGQRRVSAAPGGSTGCSVAGRRGGRR